MIFLLEDARGPFAALIDKGLAQVVESGAIAGVIARTPKLPTRPSQNRAPDINDTLDELIRMAGGYGKLCTGRADMP